MLEDMNLLLSLLPKIDDTTAGNHKKEFSELIYHRVIATLIPNELPSNNPTELQKYFIEKVHDRTGIKYDKRNMIINRLVILSRKFHNGRVGIPFKVKDTECSNCKLSFENGHIGIQFFGSFDILNPGTYPKNTNKMSDSFRDHIVPVSKIGGNEEENFQALCYICNSGKTNICADIDRLNLYSERIKIERKEEYFKLTKGDFIFFPFALFYRVLNRDKGCLSCGKNNFSLTVMPIDKETLFTYDNLVTVCYGCLNQVDTFSFGRWKQN